MGAWGHGNFDNDDAGDWLYELEDSSDLSVVASVFDAVLQDPNGYLESPSCCNALAAAEIVAALSGKPASNLPDNAQAWVRGKSTSTAETVSKAKAAVARVRSKSELRELWEETDEFDNWLKVLDELDARL